MKGQLWIVITGVGRSEDHTPPHTALSALSSHTTDLVATRKGKLILIQYAIILQQDDNMKFIQSLPSLSGRV